mmetsp:Transcript_9575/g.23856  ORF Transcript_9575/g.23856 Transcript_9575/m.23856 type:complete len:513 (-) Transcript_9575:169-1707(-)
MVKIEALRIFPRRSFPHGVTITTPTSFKTNYGRHASRFASQQKQRLFSTAPISAALPPSLRRREHEYRGPKLWPSIYEEVRDMATVSNLSYPISFLIRQAKAGKLNNNSRVFERFSLIRDGDIHSGPLSPKELLEIVEDNRDCIEREYCSHRDLESKYGWLHALNHWVKVEESRHFIGSMSLLEFDDHYDAHRLAYGLFINRIKKQIVVVFRGTYTEGTDDWKRNLQSELVEIPVPPNLLKWEKQKQDGELEKDHPLPSKMKLHRGLYEYLFDNPEKGPRFKRERHEEIMSVLLQCLRENQDYDVYVIGHSLGGALAEVFAFYLSTTISDYKAYLPTLPHITCVSIGSMVTGDANFARALWQLEQTERLRYLRVANEDDPVCYYPPLEGYALSGMQLRFNRHSGHALWHPRTRRKFLPSTPDSDHHNEHLHRDTSLYACTNSDMTEAINSWPNLIRALHSSKKLGTGFIYNHVTIRDHMVPSYLRQLEREKEFLSQITLADLNDKAQSIPHE